MEPDVARRGLAGVKKEKKQKAERSKEKKEKGDKVYKRKDNQGGPGMKYQAKHRAQDDLGENDGDAPEKEVLAAALNNAGNLQKDYDDEVPRKQSEDDYTELIAQTT